MIDAQHRQRNRLARLVLTSAPILFALAGALAYMRAEWDPSKGVFFLLVGAFALAVGAATVRLWMAEPSLTAIPSRHTLAGEVVVFWFHRTSDGFEVSYAERGGPTQSFPFTVADPDAFLSDVQLSRGAQRHEWRTRETRCVAFSTVELSDADRLHLRTGAFEPGWSD